MIDRYTTPEMKALWSEAERYRVWLEVELAATQALEELGEVPAGTSAELRAAAARRPLDEAFAARVAELEAVTRHDVVAFTRALAERFGDGARYVHYGLTSTDVVDTAQNLLLVRALDLILADLGGLLAVVTELAQRYRHTPAIGRTHGVHAEPMTFGLKFLSFRAALQRDAARLRAAREAIGVAMLSGSVGTFAHLPPAVEERVAAQLGLAPDPVSNQTVARDRHAQLLGALAILGTSVERVAVEVRHLQRSEVREAQEGFAAGQTGSSSMPHKKNPIASENLSGIARLLRSNLQAALENVALWHERDISHSSVERVILPDTTTLASYALRRLTRVLRALVVDEARLRANLDALHGLVYSQRVLHLLIEAGLSREAAYELVQRASLTAWETGTHLRELLAAEPGNPLSAAELAAAFDPAWYLRHVDAIYARNGL
ncbi:MAG: adenylosuccinate lyase [Deinococcales bacterium]|nr:adenylosuccinate lyase [Deinococcales bacterium]